MIRQEYYDKNMVNNPLLSDYQKNKQSKQWYRDNIDKYISYHDSYLNETNYLNTSRREIIESNKELLKGNLDKNDIVKVLHPFKSLKESIADDFTHKDILTPKINAILKLELKRPLKKRLVAVNSESTTEIEEKENELLKNYVTSEIMADVIPDQQSGQKMTPPKIKKFIKKKYQTILERTGNQILQFLKKEEKLHYKFTNGLKNILLGNGEVFKVFVNSNSEPKVESVDISTFSCDRTKDFVEDGAWAVYEQKMHIVDFLQEFKDDLTDEQITEIIDSSQNFGSFRLVEQKMEEEYADTISVYHIVWKSMRELSILTYIDKYGEKRDMLVDNSYKINPKAGDLYITKKYFPEVYEGYFVYPDIYFRMQPLPGQFKDIDNLDKSKLPYVGYIGGPEYAILSRVKEFVYLFDAIFHRLEKLMAADRGKKALIDQALIKSVGSVPEFLEMVEKSPTIPVKIDGEIGRDLVDLSKMVKEVDFSTTSDIKKYADLALLIRNMLGISMGIPEELEGHISPYMPVKNAENVKSASTSLIDVLLYSHNVVKTNVLQYLLEITKVAWFGKGKRKLVYIADDLTRYIFEVDPVELDNTTYGLFIEENTNYDEIKASIAQFAHAAMQNQSIAFSAALKVMKEQDVDVAEEILEQSEQEQREFAMQAEQQKTQAELQKEQQEFNNQKELEILKGEIEKDVNKNKEEERRQTEIMKAALMGASFNPEVDNNDNNKNDFLEIFEKEKQQADKIKQNLAKSLAANFKKQNIDEQKQQQQSGEQR